MNVVPADGVRVPPERLRTFVAAVLDRVGVRPDQASLLAELLVRNDLRGVFSHGSRQIATYSRDLRSGKLNARPDPRVEWTSPATAVVEGDGGLGYFPAHRAALELTERVGPAGQPVAVAVSRHHGHFGAAGLYSRMLASADLLGYVTSGHQLELRPGMPLADAAGGSPMSFAVPAGTEAPFVLDFGAMHDLYSTSPYREAIFALAPGLVFRSVGLGAACQIFGGFVADVPSSADRGDRAYPGANQGSLMIAVDIGRFMAVERFKSEMDDYVRQVHALQPMPGYDRASLPGELEWAREREWALAGVPVGSRHLTLLQDVALEFGVEPPA